MTEQLFLGIIALYTSGCHNTHITVITHTHTHTILRCIDKYELMTTREQSLLAIDHTTIMALTRRDTHQVSSGKQVDSVSWSGGKLEDTAPVIAFYCYEYKRPLFFIPRLCLKCQFSCIFGPMSFWMRTLHKSSELVRKVLT